MLKNKKLSNKSKPDYLLIFSVVLVAIIGTIFIYSASRYSANATYGDELYFVKKQLIGIALGVVAMFLTCNYNFLKLKKFTIPVCIVSIIALILVFIPGIGVENYGAKRWIGVGGIT
ncbi:MAG: FtsW/RodA/SpoVE family cell cycle protein, partial [Clostridia bacterium]|nr:FtsW/RodA/SpoVE family cell cycle protein [Clostridia bacterium]